MCITCAYVKIKSERKWKISLRNKTRTHCEQIINKFRSQISETLGGRNLKFQFVRLSWVDASKLIRLLFAVCVFLCFIQSIFFFSSSSRFALTKILMFYIHDLSLSQLQKRFLFNLANYKAILTWSCARSVENDRRNRDSKAKKNCIKIVERYQKMLFDSIMCNKYYA